MSMPLGGTAEPLREFLAGVNPESLVDVAEVVFDGLRAEEQRGGGFPRGFPAGEQTERHYGFAGYVTGFGPGQLADRQALGYRDDERVCRCWRRSLLMAARTAPRCEVLRGMAKRVPHVTDTSPPWKERDQ